MNTSPMRFAFVFIFLAIAARAHVPLGSPLVIPLGEERTFYIVADVEEENATMYSLKGNTNPAIAKVTSKENFSQKFYGSWTIKAEALGLNGTTGTTTITFHWKYLKDKSGNEGERDETVLVQVVPQGSAAAANAYHLTMADPVNSRNGEYYGVEALDLNLRGPMPLMFGRYYSSSLVADGVAAGALGANRLHSYDWKLSVELQDRRVAIRTNRGRVVRFEKRFLKDKGWTQIGRTDVVFSLIEDEGIFYFSSPASQMIWAFDGTGKLTTISDGRGNTHTLTYNGSNQISTVSDGLGRILTFTHTGGRISSVADHTGRHVDFTYNGINLATAADTLAKVTTYAYNGAGLLTSFARPEGNTPFTQVYTAGKVTQQTERGTDTTTMSYAPNSTTITQPGGSTMVHNYAPTGELAAYTDEGGKTVAATSDTAGRRSGVIDRTGDPTSITYHAPSGLPATVTNAERATSTMTYKARVLDGRTFYDLVKVAFADKTFETFTYDARGNMLLRTDRAGKKWAATYNERGQPLTVTNPTGGVITMTYDATGHLITSKDSATGLTSYAYDNLSRLTQITRPGGATVVFQYDPRDRVTRMTDERNQRTDYAYDDNNRLTDITDADTNATTIAYDSLDRVEQVTDRLQKVSTRTYNSRRLLAGVTDRNNNTTTFDYDDRQRPTTATDPGGKTWALGFDDESQLTSSQNPLDPPARIRRNALGRPIEISNALGHTAQLSRDVMQRVVQRFDLLGRATKFTYDKRGALLGVAEEGGGAAKYTRDALGNVTSITAPDGGLWKRNYTKEGRLHESTDPLGKTWHRGYDTRGRLATLENPDGVTQTVSYDGASNVTRLLFEGGGTLDNLQFDFFYDNLGRLSAAHVPGAAPIVVDFTYDAEGRLTRSQQQAIFDATYDDGGRLITASHNSGAMVVTYTYDTRNRLTSVTDNLSNATVSFTHDDAGRLTAITRGNALNSTFTYDAASRLTRLQHGAAIDIKYTLNAAGEIKAADTTAPVLSAVQAAAQAFAFGKAGQLTTAGYTYDERGRLTASPAGQFTWDRASRLTNAAGAVLEYNALGEMITRATGPFQAGLTRFFHHHAIGGSPIVAERTEATNTFTRYYVHTPGGTLLYYVDAVANTPFYYHFDHLGSTLALSNAAGNITDSYAHGPFGENEQHTGPSTQPFTWLGALGVRKEGVLYQMGHRYYDPQTARFLSRDPIRPRLADVKSLNPYSYANNNPLRYVDPRGTDSFPWVIPGCRNDLFLPAWAAPAPMDDSGFPAAVSCIDTGRISGFTLIEGGCDIEGGDDRGGSDGSDDCAYDRYDGWPNVMVQVLDSNGFRFVPQDGDSRDESRIEHMHISGGGGFVVLNDNVDMETDHIDTKTAFDIVSANAAKFGGVVHSSKGSLVRSALEVIESSPSMNISNNAAAGIAVVNSQAAPAPAAAIAPRGANPNFDVLGMLNNINRINPFSWILNGHAPLTTPN